MQISSERTTSDRILGAAEVLFAEHGFGGTSLRAVTTAADVNLAAVNYHFQSKHQLLKAVLDRLLIPVNEERRKNLRELLKAGPPTLEDILDVFLTPAFRVIVDLGPRGRTVAKLIGRLSTDPTPAVRRIWADQFEGMGALFIAALAQALPELSRDEVAWRFQCMIGTLIIIQAEGTWKEDLPPNFGWPEVQRFRDMTAAFLRGGFSAPPTAD
jgi:AcrR family transcriptional regulator